MPKIIQVSIQDFLELSEKLPVLDTRSEGEFHHGHIAGAQNFPILNDKERAEVGTCYKKKGHEAAVIMGYELVGPKFHAYIKQAYKKFPGKKVLVHCYRGGLRSKILSYVLNSAGFDIVTLVGGYKAYRKYILSVLDAGLQLKVIGGYTGSEKSHILQTLKESGEQIIDIEMLANHRGSAFGSIGLANQPTQEQFENNLAHAMAKLDFTKKIWMEDEGRMTGKLKMPDKLYAQLRNAPVYFINKSFEERSEYILNTYGKFDKKILIESTQKLKKRLGDMRMRQAVSHLENGEMKEWLNIVLAYYDKTYLFGLQQRDKEKIIYIKDERDLIQQFLDQVS